MPIDRELLVDETRSVAEWGHLSTGTHGGKVAWFVGIWVAELPEGDGVHC